MSFPLLPLPPRRMEFDAAEFLRVDARERVGISGSGAEFATSGTWSQSIKASKREALAFFLGRFVSP